MQSEKKQRLILLFIVFIALFVLNSMIIPLPFYSEERPMIWHPLSWKVFKNFFSISFANDYSGNLLQVLFSPMISLFGYNSSLVHIIITIFSSASLYLYLATYKFKESITLFFLILSSSMLLVNFSLLRYEIMTINLVLISLALIRKQSTYQFITLSILALTYKFGIIFILAYFSLRLDRFLTSRKDKKELSFSSFLILLWSISYIYLFLKGSNITFAPSPFEKITSSYLKDFWRSIYFIFIDDLRFIPSLFFSYLLFKRKFFSIKEPVLNISFITLILSLLFIPCYDFQERYYFLAILCYFIIIFHSLKEFINFKIITPIVIIFAISSNIFSFINHSKFTLDSYAYKSEVQTIQNGIKLIPKEITTEIETNFPLTLYLRYPKYNYVDKSFAVKEFKTESCYQQSETKFFISTLFMQKDLIDQCEKLHKQLKGNRISIIHNL
jgi:hypothetical protein